MLNKRKETGPWVYMSVCVIVVTLGIFMIVNAFKAARDELVQEHNDHLLDIAWSADRNIANILDRCMVELDYTVERCHSAAEHYSRSGDLSLLSDQLQKLPVMKSNYVSRILFMDENETITRISSRTEELPPDEAPYRYEFPYGMQDGGIFFCVNVVDGADDVKFFAVSKCDKHLGYRYVMLIEQSKFFRVVLGSELEESSYWMGLYDPDNRMVIQIDPDYAPVAQVDPEAVMQRGGGVGALVKYDQSGEIDTHGYIFEDTVDGTSQERLIAVIPRSQSNNRAFAVGVSVESSHYFKVIRNLVGKIAAYALVILLAVFVMLVLLYRHRRRNDEIREQIGLLEEQNRNMQELVDKTKELAHHQRLEMIGTMTSSIAHEFNNLLTPIMGYSLMTMEAMPEGCEELFDNVAEIYEASFRAKTLVSRLSGLSRKNSDATSRLLSPDTILTKVRDVAQPSVPRKVTVVQELNCPEECLYGDETQITQLALNLVINAFQAMEEKGGSLTISTAPEGDEVVMRFADTGPGMTPEVVEHIFEPFYTTKDVSRGTGLGLAIVKQTVESHHGTIEVDSELGKGTTFTVRFPKHTEEPAEK